MMNLTDPGNIVLQVVGVPDLQNVEDIDMDLRVARSPGYQKVGQIKVQVGIAGCEADENSWRAAANGHPLLPVMQGGPPQSGPKPSGP
jgi:hypothetical protein